MGQRRDFRFDTNQAVGVTVLAGASQDDTHLKGCMVNLSGRGLSLNTESSIPIGSAVRIDVNDNILLGEVCHSRQTGPTAFVCGVQLEQALTSVEDLSRLVARLMGEAPVPAEDAPKAPSRVKALFSRF